MNRIISRIVSGIQHADRRAHVAAGASLLVVAGAIVAAFLAGPGHPDRAQAGPARREAKTLLNGAAGPSSVAADAAPGLLGTSAQPEGDVAAGGASSGAGVATASPVPPPAGGGLVPDPGAKVVRTATIEVEVKKRAGGRAFDRVSAIATEMGGYVATSSRSRGSGAAAQLELRVPVARFDETRRLLAGVGKVRSEQLRGQDVGAQLVDLDARLKSLQAEEATLRTLMAQARTVGEVLQVQPQLFEVRRQIEQITAQRASLDQQAAFSTFDVAVFEAGAASTKPEPKADSILVRDAKTAWHAGLAVVGGMLVTLGVLVPFTLLAALILGGFRLRRRPGSSGEAAVASP